MKTKLLFPLFALAVLFTSCEQCYDCIDYDYCYSCDALVDSFTVQYDDCFETSSSRDNAMNDLKSDFENQGYTVTCTSSKSVVVGNDIEICDKKKDADAKAQTKETSGYECVAR